MARAKPQRNGRLEEAMAILLQNQAAFLARISEMDRINSERDRINSERFARIEDILLEHSRIFDEHTRILEALPEAIRQKNGFKAPDQSRPAD